MASPIMARLVREAGGKLLDLAASRLESPVAPVAGAVVGKKASLTRKVAGAALMKVATRSVPGAIVVGGAVLAKTLYDRRHARKDGAPKNGASKGGKARP